MNKFTALLALVAILSTLTPTIAQAGQAERKRDALLERCEKAFGERSDPLEIAFYDSCTQEVQIAYLEVHLKAGQADVKAELDTLREQNDQLQAAIKRLEEQAASADTGTESEHVVVEFVGPAPAPRAAPAAASPSHAGGQAAFVGGASHRRVAPRHVISTRKGAVDSGAKLTLVNMASAGVWNWARGQTNLRVAVINHGQPCRPDYSGYAPTWCEIDVQSLSQSPTGRGGFSEAVVDLYRDGNPQVAWVTDVRDLELTWRASDQIELVWLVETGEFEQVPGVGYLPVWQPTRLPLDCNKGSRQQLGGNKNGGPRTLDAAHGTAVCNN